MRKYTEEFSEKIFIYTLSNPDTFEVRYVGISKNIKRRYKEHIKESKKGNNYKSCWIRSLNKMPIIDIIDECSIFDYTFWEKYYITLFKSWGFKLTNLTDGGEGANGYRFNQESKNKMSENRKGDKNGFYGKKHSEENKILMSYLKAEKYDGDKNPMYGKKHKDLSKIIMSQKKKNLYNGENNPRAKKLYQYTLEDKLIKIWNTAKECADFYFISRGNISAFAKHNTNKNNNISYKILNGYIFKFT